MPGKVRSGAAITPRWARRPFLVLVITFLALVAFGTTTQTWLSVQLDPGQLGQGLGSPLAVPGNKAATAVTALALVAVAGGIAASIAGPVARWVIAGLIILAAAGIVIAAATVIANPLGAAQGAIAEATGVSGGRADVGLSVFPILAMATGVLLGCSGLVLGPAGRYWKTRTRFDAHAADSEITGEAASDIADEAAGKAAGKAAAAGPVDEIDTWDRLSRGDDPT